MRANPPDLSRLNGRALKRQLSQNVEQRGRRQAQFICGVPYETIVEGALRAFMPLVDACVKPHTETYEQTFCGRNSHGMLDRNMRLTIHAQHYGALPNLEGQWYRLWVTLRDDGGRVRIQEAMQAAGVPLVDYVLCMGRPRTYEELAAKQATLRAELVRIIHPWLEWFGKQFSYT